MLEPEGTECDGVMLLCDVSVGLFDTKTTMQVKHMIDPITVTKSCFQISFLLTKKRLF